MSADPLFEFITYVTPVPTPLCKKTTELIHGDFIVIPRADLPEVSDEGITVRDADGTEGGIGWPERYRSTTPNLAHRARRTAAHFLAVAEYLDAHPPVDEAEVEALAEEVRRIGGPSLGGGSTPTPDEFARRLVAAGWKR